ncbi:MAG: hypothetical protein C4291_13690 [Candidatus Dadabacteria bacterium]
MKKIGISLIIILTIILTTPAIGSARPFGGRGGFGGGEFMRGAPMHSFGMGNRGFGMTGSFHNFSMGSRSFGMGNRSFGMSNRSFGMGRTFHNSGMAMGSRNFVMGRGMPINRTVNIHNSNAFRSTYNFNSFNRLSDARNFDVERRGFNDRLGFRDGHEFREFGHHHFREEFFEHRPFFRDRDIDIFVASFGFSPFFFTPFVFPVVFGPIIPCPLVFDPFFFTPFFALNFGFVI